MLSTQLESHGVGARGERRFDPRVLTDAPAVAIFDGRPHRYRLHDISLGGASLEHGDNPPPPVHAMILRAGKSWMKVLARTIWSRGGRHGVRFVAQSEVDRLELGEIIDQLATAR
jgi:hypothetical protein